MKTATVADFLIVLTSKLTQQDQKEYAAELKRGGRGNIYRLGLLLEAKYKVEKDVAKYLARDDAEAMAALKASLSTRFNDNFPPYKNVIKQIDAWLAKGKCPSLVSK